MSNHTPGKWEVAGRMVYALNEEGTNRFDAFVQSGWESKESRTTNKELAANARLIAAAPELHEANQLFVQAVNHMQGITADHSDDRIYDEMPSSQLASAYFAARTALAKARGEA